MLSVLVIPALNPSQLLLDLFEAYQKRLPKAPVIVVNDGSTQGLEIFDHLKEQGCIVLHHTQNQGKGAALKTAIRYYLDHGTGGGIVTADADGQHTIEDIVRVNHTFSQHPTQLCLGVRNWKEANIPWRSKIGNQLTRALFKRMTRYPLQDTQTGLRAIPRVLMQPLLQIEANRFEFEFEMLFIAKKQGITLKEIAIQTVYLEGNRHSHFRPLWDSMRIYFIFIRYSVIALVSCLLDFAVFSLAYGFLGSLGWAVLTGRAVSSPFNFILNKKGAFHDRGKWAKEALLYFSLVCVAGYVVLQLMQLFTFSGLNPYLSKILAESLVFLMNFFIQHKLIFTERSEEVSDVPSSQ